MSWSRAWLDCSGGPRASGRRRPVTAGQASGRRVLEPGRCRVLVRSRARRPRSSSACSPPPSGAGWWDDLDRGQGAPTSDVIAQPAGTASRTSPSSACSASATTSSHRWPPRSTPQKHENLAVWTDGSPVWEKERLHHDFPFLYLRRSHPQHARAHPAGGFTRHRGDRAHSGEPSAPSLHRGPVLPAGRATGSASWSCRA